MMKTDNKLIQHLLILMLWVISVSLYYSAAICYRIKLDVYKQVYISLAFLSQETVSLIRSTLI